MKILLIGSGGREHAIAKKLTENPKLDQLFIAPGNPGTAEHGTNIALSTHDEFVEFAKTEAIDLTFVGPEQPLVDGLVDRFEEEDLAILGPNKEAAQLEGSKDYAKKVMTEANIPTAAYATFTSLKDSLAYVKGQNNYPTVIKADGLAAGKGVTIAHSETEAETALKACFVDASFGEAGHQVVIEDFLSGEEASVFALVDGTEYVVLGAAQDHKAAYDGDKGPNTGGMGTYSPAPLVTDNVMNKVKTQIITPLVETMAKNGTSFRGLLFVGLMIDESGNPSVVEFNVRFGDPETQVILNQLETDLLDLFIAAQKHQLADKVIRQKPGSSVCVVACSGGYPGNYEKGKAISGLDLNSENTHVIHAGTKQTEEGVVTSGGRVLGVVHQANSLKEAVDGAYDHLSKIHFEEMFYRKDIGQKGLRI